jgi:hypothetical protein
MALDTIAFSHRSLDLSHCVAYVNIDDSPGQHGNLAKPWVEVKVDSVGGQRIVAHSET